MRYPTISICRSYFLAITPKIFFFIMFAQNATNAQTEWEPIAELKAADKNSIVTLAKKMGIENPRRISFRQIMPSFCGFVCVESEATESNHLKSWLELEVYRKDWTHCMSEHRGSKTHRSGRWIARSSDLQKQEEWIIEDNGWKLYLPFGAGVPFEDAEIIVLAIRHDQLINRLSTDTPKIDPNTISLVAPRGKEPRTYEVHTGKGMGHYLIVRIADRKVELLSIGKWMT